MNVNELKQGYHMFGNKGNLWNDTAHVAKTGFDGKTLCGTPMLSTNWCKIENVQRIGCPECIAKYIKVAL